jgi:hypothetical protein
MSSSSKKQPSSAPNGQPPSSSQQQLDSQNSQSSQPKKLSLNPIINSFTRKLISQREEAEQHDKNTLDDERLRESLDRLKTGKFLEGASTASGELSIDTQECMPLKWYKENSKTLWIVLVPDDLITPSKDIAPRQGIFAKAIKDAIHEAMHNNLKNFGKWFSSKGQILSPVSVDVNNSNPNDITAIFCPPADVQCPDLVEHIKQLEAVVPIPYKSDLKPKKPGLFFISFTEFNPLDDITVLALSFHISFSAEAVRKNFSKAADIITKFFATKEIDLATPEFELSLPHPIKDDDKSSKGRATPAKLLVTYNAPDLAALQKITLIVGRMHGTTIHIPDSISMCTSFSIRVHCKIFEHRIETERPLWTKDIIETLHTESQTKAAQNIDSVLKLLFCHHHISDKGEDMTGIRKKLNLLEADNKALTDDLLLAKLQTLIADKIIQVSPSNADKFMLSPNKRKWTSLKLILQDQSVFKLQQRDLGIDLTTSFGLPPDHSIPNMTCFYLTTSCAVLATHSGDSPFTAFDLWKYMTNRFKQYQSFIETTPQSTIESYSEALERTSAIEHSRMSPSFLLQYASECAISASPNSYVNPLAACCLAFPSEFKAFNWLFLQMKDKVGTQEEDDVTASLEFVYHIKTENKDAKTIFIKYTGSFHKGESNGHFVSLNVPPSKSEEFTDKCISSASNGRYIAVYSTWPSGLLELFPIKEAQHLIYESSISKIGVSEIVVVDSSQEHRIDADNTDSQHEGGTQPSYDEDDHALTNVIENLELIALRLRIAFSRTVGYSTLDCSATGRNVLTRRLDELLILSKEISTHVQNASSLALHFPTASDDQLETLNPKKILETMDTEAQGVLLAIDAQIDRFRSRLAEIQSQPEQPIPPAQTKPISISRQILRIRSTFTVDSVATDLDMDQHTRRLRLFDTFWIFPTKNSKLSFYQSVLVACAQPKVKSKLLQEEKTHFSHILTKDVTNDVVSMFEQTTNAMFRGFADCAICSTSNVTFNDYLERKKAPKNVWEAMPEDHFLCTPSLVAQAWQLNIMILWKKRGITRIFALPHGTETSPIIPVLFSADQSILKPDGNPSIIASFSANRFYPLSICEDKVETWESAFSAEPATPDSVQSTLTPIITATFVKKIDKEFAFQSSVMVDGPGKNGQEVSGDETSERTIDGLNDESQALMEAFIDDQSDNDEQGPPSYNPVLEQVDKEMAIRKLTEANLAMFKQIRRRRILDDDDDSQVPMIQVHRTATNPPSRPPQHVATTATGNPTRPPPQNQPTSGVTTRTTAKKVTPATKPNAKSATAKDGDAAPSSSQ